MEELSKENVKNLLKSRDIQPKKEFGQNFLIDRSAMARILAAAGITRDDLVLEIGAGVGNLTQELAKSAKKVIAVEKDREMTAILQTNLADFKNITIIEDDIRHLEPKNLGLEPGDYKVVANIPYYLTAFLIRSLLESQNPPKDITLVIQKEVAQRICAKPPEMNLLAVSVQFYAESKIISYIKKTSFWPMPKVDSAIIKITARPKAAGTDSGLFFKILKAGFLQPRKQLPNNLASGLKMEKKNVAAWLLQNNIRPNQRAETLSLENWLSLTKSYFENIKKAAVFKN